MIRWSLDWGLSVIPGDVLLLFRAWGSSPGLRMKTSLLAGPLSLLLFGRGWAIKNTPSIINFFFLIRKSICRILRNYRLLAGEGEFGAPSPRALTCCHPAPMIYGFCMLSGIWLFLFFSLTFVYKQIEPGLLLWAVRSLLIWGGIYNLT